MSNNSKQYPVNEKFYTFQGEGSRMGHAAYFIRLHGCPVHCSFCDSAATWHKDFVPTDIERFSAEALALAAASTRTDLVVLTGGEPCIHDLDPLVEALQDRSLTVAVETCGAFAIPMRIDHVTVSPKWAKLPTKEALMRADEIKLIVEDTDSLDRWSEALSDILGMTVEEYYLNRGADIWLHPEWSQRSNPAVLGSIVAAVKNNAPIFRAGYQLHKVYAADAFDSGARPQVPLGGNPAKGL